MDFSPEGPKAIPLWINGHAFLTAGDRFYEVSNPATGEAIRRVPLSGAAEAAEAAGAALAAQSAWADMGLQARRVCLARLADELDHYRGHFAKLLLAESGLDEAAASAEVVAAVDALRGASVGETGVIGLVLDATQPLANFARAAAPALMAGATIVVKPSPKAPSAIFALCELSSRAEWPAGVLNLVHGDTAAIEGLCASTVDRLVYVGHAALGEQIATIAAAAGKTFCAQPD